jgi:hypothetical protein
MGMVLLYPAHTLPIAILNFNRQAHSLRIALTINFHEQYLHNISQKLFYQIHLEKNYPMIYFL